MKVTFYFFPYVVDQEKGIHGSIARAGSVICRDWPWLKNEYQSVIGHIISIIHTSLRDDQFIISYIGLISLYKTKVSMKITAKNGMS